MGVAREVYNGVKILLKCTWFGSKFVVKNTPAALGMVWEVKKEINAALAQGVHDAKLEYQRHCLERKIEQLSVSKEPKKLEKFDVSIDELLKIDYERREHARRLNTHINNL